MSALTERDLERMQPKTEAPIWADVGWARFEEALGRLLVVVSIVVVLAIAIGAIE